MIEIVPLASMMGRTLNPAFLILDETQNSTSGAGPAQMKMFLTCMGVKSRIVVTGDPIPPHLPRDHRRGWSTPVGGSVR